MRKILYLTKGTKVLDIPCGHGRHAIELSRQGCVVTGIDINSFFLDMAATEAKRENINIRWLKSDMRCVPFCDEFDIAIDMFTSFGYLESDEDDRRVLYQIARALRQGGQFVLDVINREYIIRNYCDKEQVKFGDDSIIIERRFDFSEGRNFEKRVRVWPDGRVKERYISVRMYTLVELIAMCKTVDLQFNVVYGDYSDGPLSLDSKRCILVAQKK